MDDNKERFIRWQTRLIEHSSYINNLLLSIGIAIIGFVFSNLSSEYKFHCCEKLFLIIGLIFIALSVLFGLVGSFSRLFDFKTTVSVIRLKIKNNNCKDDEIEDLRKLYQIFGRITWLCFYSQVVCLSLGTINITVYLFLKYSLI